MVPRTTTNLERPAEAVSPTSPLPSISVRAILPLARLVQQLKQAKEVLLWRILLANSKTKLVLSQSSQYSERENRIRQQYPSVAVPVLLSRFFSLCFFCSFFLTGAKGVEVTQPVGSHSLLSSAKSFSTDWGVI